MQPHTRSGLTQARPIGDKTLKPKSRGAGRSRLAFAALLAATLANAHADRISYWADESQVAQAQARLGLPRPLALAASWDRELVQQSYSLLGAELARAHKQAALTPELDVLRDLRRGDASAGFGEDPFLTGELGVAAVQGLQTPAKGKPQIWSVVGHVAGPQLPPAGSDLGPIPVSPRELREVFLAPFERVAKQAQPGGLLMSDNEIDGIPSHGNAALIGRIRQEGQFKGAVVGSTEGLQALIETYHVAASPEEAVRLARRTGFDAMAFGPISMLTDKTGKPGGPPAQAPANPSERAAREAVVLLKNDGALPLSKSRPMPVLRVADASPAALSRLKPPAGRYVLVLSGRLPLPSEALTALVEQACAVLAGFELGTHGEKALDEALHGRVNPGGKLPLSLARNEGQLPMFYNVKPSAWRGYLFDTTEPLFPFGWGLSYTRFEIGAPVPASASIRIGEAARVSVSVRNSGARAGDEVVQLYLHHKTASTTEPVKQLVGFARVSKLQPGESRQLEFSVSAEQLSLWNEQMQRVQEAGEIELMAGSNSVELQAVTLKVQEQ